MGDSTGFYFANYHDYQSIQLKMKFSFWAEVN